MWTRNNNVLNWNMLKHFIYSSFSKSTTSSLCSLYYKYSSKVSSFFCILSFLVKAISIDQTFYSAMHYLAAVWLNSRHDLNSLWFIWIDQLVQSDSLKEIRFYLIHLNNDQRVIQEIKNKLKHVENVSKTIFHKATVVTQSVNHSKFDHLKSRDAILTSVKEADILVESCFIYHKSDHCWKQETVLLSLWLEIFALIRRSNLRINSTLVNEYLPFAHFFSSFIISYVQSTR